MSNGEWKMPDPVFRSTEGHDPRLRRLSQDDIPTDSPDVDTDEFDTDTPEQIILDESADPAGEPPKPKPAANTVRAAPPAAAGGKGSGCLKTLGVVGGVVLAGAVLLIAVLIYLLFFYQPGETTF